MNLQVYYCTPNNINNLILIIFTQNKVKDMQLEDNDTILQCTFDLSQLY